MIHIKPNPFKEFPRIEFIFNQLVDDYNEIIDNPSGQQERREKMKKDIEWLHKNVPAVLKFAKNCVTYIDGVGIR